MRLKTLIEKFTNDDIVNNVIKIYPDQKKNIKGYFKAIKEIKKLEPILNKIYIDIRLIEDEGKKYPHIYGIQNSELVAIEFVDWREWLGMRINSTTIKNFSELDIISHCLWEMTWRGYSNKEVKKSSKELFRTVKEIECIK